MCLSPRIGKKWSNSFLVIIYLISFPQSEKYFTNDFCYNEKKNIPRIGKNFNDLYYFQKAKNIREANCKMYLFISMK